MNKTKMILIGLDGCDFRILKPMINDGYLPTFSELLEGGCHGTLMSTLPFNTLPAWTSIFTGVNPGKHGITGFIIRENGEFKIANNSYRMTDTLWAILSRHDLKQIIINEPVTYPPEKVNGIMLTGFSTPLQSENFAYPPPIKDEISKAGLEYQTYLPFRFEEIIAENKHKGFELINEFANKIFKVTKYLGTNYEWDLLSVIFTSTDRLQHFYYTDMQYMKAHYKLIDGFINEIMNMEPNANIMIVSDHGFGPLKKCFYINTWLKEQKLVVENQSFLNTLLSHAGLTYEKLVSMLMRIKLYKTLANITPMSIKRSIPQSTIDKNVDFNKSIILYPELNGGLFINKYLTNHHISILKEKLTSLTLNGERPIEHLYRRKDVIWGPYTYRAADIFLMPKYGYEISNKLMPSLLSAPQAFGDIRTGVHRPEGVFIAYGHDIKEGCKLNFGIHTWDIAPTLLHILGLLIPKYMDGKVMKQIFKEGSDPATRPVKITYLSEREKISRRLKMIRTKTHKKDSC